MKASSSFLERIKLSLFSSPTPSNLTQTESSFIRNKKFRFSALATTATMGAFIPLIACNSFPSQHIAKERPFNETIDTDHIDSNPVHNIFTDNLRPADISHPTKNPRWFHCDREELQTFSTGPLPSGVHLDCADIQVPLEPSQPQGKKISIAIMKVFSDFTPRQAPPVFFTTGASGSSIEALTHWAVTHRDAQLLSQFPLIAIDRRGVGNSGTFMCIDKTANDTLHNLGSPGMSLEQRAQAVISASHQSYADCSTKPGLNLRAYNFINATHDIDSIRQALGMDKIAIDARADGAFLGLRYAQDYPNHLVRLILDSPSNFDKGSYARVEDEADAFQRAIDSFEHLCIKFQCPIHDNPHAKFHELLHRARRNQLSGLTDAAILKAIRVHMSIGPDNVRDAVNDLGNTVYQALNGNLHPLDKMVKWANAEYNTGSQIFVRCAIDTPRLTKTQYEHLLQDWRARYPETGEIAALTALSCTGWPGIEHVVPVNHIDIPVLLLYGQHDPIIGHGAINNLKNQLNNSHTTYQTVEWDNFGHGVLAHSDCAGVHIRKYIASGELPTQRIVCPT